MDEPEIYVIEDADRRRLVLRNSMCISTPIRSYREVQSRGIMFAPSFEREGERHTLKLDDGTEIDGGITGEAPTRFTARSAAKMVEVLGRGSIIDAREVEA
jgi:hypothetical protein